MSEMLIPVRQAFIKMPMRPSKRWIRSKLPKLMYKYCGLAGINMKAPFDKVIGWEYKDFLREKVTLRIQQELKYTVDNN